MRLLSTESTKENNEKTFFQINNLKSQNLKMRITQRQFLTSLLFLVLFFVSFIIITNLYMSLYEAQEKYNELQVKMDSLYSYFNKFTNISFPISYSLQFYENYYEMPIIYIITPTDSKRATQLADLTRLRNTLWLVPKIVWILVEDSPFKSDKIKKFMEYSKLDYVHLNEETPQDLIIKPDEKTWSKPRGVLQRNKGLAWLRENAFKLHHAGVVYFADDDNTYDIRLFEEMRSTKKVSVWPVAFVGELMYERPICKDGKVIDWFVAWGTKRPFPIDMAGFAVNLNLLLSHPSARFSQLVQRGMQESHFLSNLVQMKELEAKADNCTKILVWHTNTRRILLSSEINLLYRNMSYDRSIINQI